MFPGIIPEGFSTGAWNKLAFVKDFFMKLQIQALSDKIGSSIPLPYYATAGAAAVDLHACIDEAVVIPAQGQAVIMTGIAVAVPEGYVGIMAARSSMGVRHGVWMCNGIGVIDSDYRGELRVGLYNSREEDYVVEPGDRIAQLMIVPVLCPEIEVVAQLPETARGTGGFGSTGR